MTDTAAQFDADMILAVLRHGADILDAPAGREFPMISVRVEARAEGNSPTLVIAVCGGGRWKFEGRKYRAAQELIAHVAELTDYPIDARGAIR